MKNYTIILFVLSFLFANSGGPNAGHANNAPNFNNCTSCHSGTANTGDGSVSFTGLPESYVPGETYEVTVSVTGTNSSGYGFQAIAQAGEDAAGSISLNSNSSAAEMNGSYIQQSASTT
jgi:cytochrome c553